MSALLTDELFIFHLFSGIIPFTVISLAADVIFLGGGDTTQATVTAGRKISLGLKYKVPRRLEARGCRKWEDWSETSNSSSNNHWLTKECGIICIPELTTQPTLKQCVNRIHTHWTLLLDLQPSIQFSPELLRLMRRDKDGQMEKGWGPLAASGGTRPTCSGTAVEGFRETLKCFTCSSVWKKNFCGHWEQS